MRSCPRCKKPLPRRKKVCPFCGARIKEKHSVKRLIGAIVILLISIGICVCLLLLIPQNVRPVLFSADPSPAPAASGEPAPQCSAVLTDGIPGVSIRVSGRDGERAFVDGTDISAFVQNGEALLEVPGETFLPQKPASEKWEGQFTVTLQSEGSSRQMTTAPVTLIIPTTPLSVLAPKGPSTVTHAEKITIETSLPEGAALWIDKKEECSCVPPSGRYRVTLPIEDGKTRRIELSAQAPFLLPVTKTLTVTRPKMEVKLSVSDNGGAVTDEGCIPVSGKTEPNAILTCSRMREGTLVLRPDGSFSFIADVSEMGWNEIELHAKTPDGRASALSFSVYGRPDTESYTRSAWPVTAKDLARCAAENRDQVFVCRGKVVEIIADSPLRFVFALEDGMEIAMRYDGEVAVTEDTNYRVFADSPSTDRSGTPALCARLIYPAEE